MRYRFDVVASDERRRSMTVKKYPLVLALATLISTSAFGMARADSNSNPSLLPDGAAVPKVGTTYPHVYLTQNVMLASVQCFPSYSIHVPAGLVGSAAENYAYAHRSEAIVTPCIRPTELSLATSGANVQQDPAAIAAAQRAYNAAIDHGALERTALTLAATAYNAASAIGNEDGDPSAGVMSFPSDVQPLFCSSGDSGNWATSNNDQVLDFNSQVKAVVYWEQWYAVAVGAGCTHTFQQTKYHINSGTVWFQYAAAYSGSSSATGSTTCVGDCGNNSAATPFGSGLTYSYSAYATSTASAGVVSWYCWQVNFIGACIGNYQHPEDLLPH